MKIKNTLIISSYVLVAALFFSVSYVAGRTVFHKDLPKPTEKPEEEIVETSADAGERAPYYLVKSEGGEVIIYKCIGNIRHAIASEKISESVFPKEDMEELRSGVRFERLENAQQLFENFVS